MQPQVLADAVEDDNRVVDVKADQSPQRGDDRQVNLDLEDGEETERHENSVKDCDDGGCAVSPLETKCDKEQHPDERGDGDGDSLNAQLFASDFADRIHADNLGIAF